MQDGEPMGAKRPGRPALNMARTMTLVAAALVAGCSAVGAPSANSTLSGPTEADGRSDLGSLTYRAIDRLVAASPGLMRGRGVVVGSIADVQRVEHSAPFGNLVADLARTRLVQKGVAVSEMRLRTTVAFDKRQGELTLANDRAAVMPPPSAAGILTGTYAAADDWIYVSLKLIAVDNARIVAAVDFAVPRRGSEALLMSPAT